MICFSAESDWRAGRRKIHLNAKRLLDAGLHKMSSSSIEQKGKLVKNTVVTIKASDNGAYRGKRCAAE